MDNQAYWDAHQAGYPHQLVLDKRPGQARPEDLAEDAMGPFIRVPIGDKVHWGFSQPEGLAILKRLEGQQ